MRIAGLICLALLLAGCGKGKPLDGQWTGDQQGSKVDLLLARDGSYLCIAAGSEPLQGTYEQTPDRLRLRVGDDTLAYNYKWVGDGKISLHPIRGVRKHVSTAMILLSRVGVAPDSVAVASGGGGPVQGSDSELCVDRLNRLEKALSMYSMDYDEVYPPSQGWNTKLSPYVKNSGLFSCPSLAKDGKDGGYAMNLDLSGQFVAAFSNPAATVGFYESADEFLGATGTPGFSALKHPRHGNAVNVVFIDGHVKPR